MNQFVLTGVGTPWQAELRQGTNKFGRHPDNQFCLPDGSVSSFHFELVVTEESVTVRDLHSTNGTFIDEQPVQQAVLVPGQLLKLGTVPLRLEARYIHIAIPEIPVEAAVAPSFLADGSSACLNHPGVPPLFQCNKCEQVFCEDCVRIMKRAGGRSMIFCTTECTGQCTPLAAAAAAAAARAKRRKKSFFGRLKETIRLGRK